jgi:DNA-binding protein Fis
MSNDSAILDRELERDTHRARAERTAVSVPPNESVLPGATTHQSASKRSLSDRIKGALSNVLKALEGDHETHHYRS